MMENPEMLETRNRENREIRGILEISDLIEAAAVLLAGRRVRASYFADCFRLALLA
jgi:hypothetical protein